jgi:signal recognition particle subunit SRP54
VFDQLSAKLSAAVKSFRGKGKITEADVDAVVKEIRTALLDADVALSVVKTFTERIREKAIGLELSGALNPGQEVVKVIHQELVQILGGDLETEGGARRLRFAKNPPTVIMLVGLQGAGKTTLAGKLAKHLKSQSQTPILTTSKRC